MVDYIGNIDLWSDGHQSDIPSVGASQVSLPFGQPVGQAGLSSDIPPIGSISGQLAIQSTGGSGWPVIRNTPIEPGRGIWWPRVTLHNINLTFGQHMGWVDMCM